MKLMNIKRLVGHYPGLNIDGIKAQIDRHEVLSFDMFDTLIKRDVQEESDVFELTERLFNKDSAEKIRNYKNIRQAAERRARKDTPREEITAELLLNALIGLKDENGFEITEKIATTLINCEQEVERLVCVNNPLIYQLFLYGKRLGKRIIIITDMYWSKAFLTDLLRICGIDGYNALYVSSEIGVRKKSGNLYKEVIRAEGVKGSSILHIGDNKRGDFLSAKKEGLAACLIPKYTTTLKYANNVKDNSFEWNCMKKFVNNRLPLLKTHEERIGYEVYGPLLYTFVDWLSDKLDPCKTTLFFARDCYVVKPAYEMYTGDASERNIYFLGSRRSLMVPALKDGAELGKVEKLIKSESKLMTISGLLRKLGVDVEQYKEELSKNHFSEDTIVDRDGLADNKAFVSFYEEIKRDIEDNAKREYDAFIAYWNSLNCTPDIQIVDIGWRGTMQRCLRNLIGDSYRIKGYYLGIRKDALIDNYEDIFLNGKENVEKECFLASMTALIEIFFSAPHGSVKKYVGANRTERLPYECAQDAQSRKLVEELHRGALQFVRDYSKGILSQIASISRELLFATLFEMGVSPEIRELRNFGSYPFQTGAGVAKTIDSKGFMQYIARPKAFLYDFANSNWKVGFLKESMKIRMPYYSMFKWIYKHRG